VVTVIIRRPHAYKFKRQHAAAPIPGVAFLNGDGEVLGTMRLPLKGAVERLVTLMSKKNWRTL
jgi:hypothetical protein